MTATGTQISFKQLMSLHPRIRIPMIQRDYAQGRPAAEDVREEFLDTLQQAFTFTPSGDARHLNLDFIYGSVEADSASAFLPLDGQQRLTTLFLLHWYLAWRDGCQADFCQVFREGTGSRFSYSVRPSSSEFFDELVNFWPEREAVKGTSLTGLITNQAWYFRYWRLDPTIQSCLTMLGAIHERFADVTGAYARLTDEHQPVITFQLLDLDHFGLSDDLYIKMNARGKPLTPFETFKARYEHDLKGQFSDETRYINGKAFSVADFFARRMDTRWADFFWAYRDKETHLYDDAIMNFLHAVAFACRDPESLGYLEEISTFRSKPLKASYSLYHKSGWLERDFSSTVMLLLEAWSEDDNRFTPLLSDNPYFNESAMFQRLVSEPASMAYTELVQLFAYVAFLRCASEVPDSQALLEWMRVICNLSINTSYERPADLQRSLSAVQALVPHSADILSYFASTEKATAGFYLQQIAEEQLKSELLLAHLGWRPLIERAEKHGYFKGQIEFLLDFSGVITKRSEVAMTQWDASVHVALQQRFTEYLGKAEMMFGARGLSSITDFRWERALLSLGDYLLKSGYNYSFLVNSASEQASWKRLLRGGIGENVLEARLLLNKLFEQINLDAPIESQLDEIIANAGEIEGWRRIMVDTPEIFRYCGEHSLRWDADQIYMLKKSRMSGMHAELFSFHLFIQLQAEQLQKKLLPLKRDEYLTVSGSEFEPYLYLALTAVNATLYFWVYSCAGGFNVEASRKELKLLPDLESSLVSAFEFVVKKESISLYVPREQIHSKLISIARTIKSVMA